MKIAIIGAAPSSRMSAPYRDPSWTIWAHSPSQFNQLPRQDAWFDLHSMQRMTGESHKTTYLAWCRLVPKLYLQEVDPRFPNSVKYPKDEIVAEFAPFSSYFLTSTAAWMMALAIYEKPEAIGLYGIDMMAREEYQHQRPGMFYFICEAKRRGIEVIIPPESAINWTEPLYGYRELDGQWMRMKARQAELNQRLNETKVQSQLCRDQQLQIMGAIEDLNVIIESNWSN